MTSQARLEREAQLGATACVALTHARRCRAEALRLAKRGQALLEEGYRWARLGDEAGRLAVRMKAQREAEDAVRVPVRCMTCGHDLAPECEACATCEQPVRRSA